jgi:hypothetical protein
VIRWLASVCIVGLTTLTTACTADHKATRTTTDTSAARASAGSTTSTTIDQSGGASGHGETRRYSIGGASILKPTRWVASPYRGMPATVVSPITFFSSAPFTRACANNDAAASKCTTPGWFPPDAHTPADGVLILWLAATFPSNVGWASLPGQNTRINGHRARVYSGPPIDFCPDGATTEVEANVLIATKPLGTTHQYPGSRLAMTACLGPHISPADRAAVMTMLHSLHIRTRYWF